MLQTSRFILCLALGCGSAMASEKGERELCDSVTFRTLSSLCQTVLRIFPIISPTGLPGEGERAVVKERGVSDSALKASESIKEAESLPPLDLSLPPLPELADQPLQDAPSLLPPLFKGTRRQETMALGGRLITSEEDTEFDLTLGSMLDQIEGAEISIEFRR